MKKPKNKEMQAQLDRLIEFERGEYRKFILDRSFFWKWEIRKDNYFYRLFLKHEKESSQKEDKKARKDRS